MSLPDHGHSINSGVAAAIRDHLADARCAIRDGLNAYALDCIRQCEALAKLPPEVSYTQIADILQRAVHLWSQSGSKPQERGAQ